MEEYRKKIKKGAALFLILCLSCAVFAGCGDKEAKLVEKGVLKVGMNLETEGLCALSQETSKPEGFEVELAQKLADKLGLEIEIVDATEENLLKSLDGEIYDCAISGIGLSKWNDRHYSHTEAYGDLSKIQDKTGKKAKYTDIAVFTKKYNPLVEKLEEKLQELKKEGVLKELSEKYFEKDITK